MVPVSLLKQFRFFDGLSDEQLEALASRGADEMLEADRVLFRPEDAIDDFYLIVDGEVGIFREPPGTVFAIESVDRIFVNRVGPGDVIGWSSLLRPYVSTAGTAVLRPTRVIRFDAPALLHLFERDGALGYEITQRLAAVIHERLHRRELSVMGEIAGPG